MAQEAYVYRPHKKQTEAHLDDHKRKLLFWGRQVGKTMWSVNHAWMEAVRVQGRYFIVFQTYTQAKEVVWKQYLDQIPKALRAKVDNTELSITLPYLKGKVALPGRGWLEIEHDINKPASTIQLLGSDQAERHRGMKAHGIVFDEYAEQNPEYWDSVYQPMFSTTGGWAVFMSTPKGYNHWFDMVDRAEANPDEWFLSKATWRDNPAVTPDFIKGVKKDAEQRGTLSTFMQEFELEFRSVQGAVFPDFNRDIHTVKPSEVPKDGSVYCAIDFGFDHPTVVLFVRIDYQGRHWIFDEIYARQTIISDLVPMIKEKLGDERLVLMVGDSAAAEGIAQLQKHFPIVPVVKHADAIPEGIRMITERLRPRSTLMGTVRPNLFIGKNCRNLIMDIEQYKYPEDKPGRHNNERPVKEHDDGPDAYRYLLIHLKYGTNNERDIIKPKVKFNQYGLL
jgi:phage terminase large subunit